MGAPINFYKRSPVRFENDAGTLLLLHFDDVDGADTYTDSSNYGHSIVEVEVDGFIEIDTAQSLFGGSSVYFDTYGLGNSVDYLEITDNSVFDLSATDTRVWEFYVMFETLPAGTFEFRFFDHGGTYPGSTDSVHCLLWRNNITLNFELIFYASSPFQSGSVTSNPITLTTNVWYYIAFSKVGNTTIKIYLDGAEVGSGAINTNAFPGTIAGNPQIGRNSSTASVKAWIDEYRISNIGRDIGKPINFYSRTDGQPINFYSLT